MWHVGVVVNTSRVLFVLAISLLAGCAEERVKPKWPAKIVSVANFSAEERTKLVSAVKALNEHFEQTMVYVDTDPPEDLEVYPISLSRVSAADWKSSQAGYATVETRKCTVELAERLFKPESQKYIQSVVWHELGHCAGRQHDKDPGEVMYQNAVPFESYASAAVSRFCSEISEAL